MHDDLPLLPVLPLSALLDSWSQKEAAKIAAIRKKRTRRTAAGKMNRKQRIQTKTLPSRAKGSRVFRPSDMMTCTFSSQSDTCCEIYGSTIGVHGHVYYTTCDADLLHVFACDKKG